MNRDRKYECVRCFKSIEWEDYMRCFGLCNSCIDDDIEEDFSKTLKNACLAAVKMIDSGYDSRFVENCLTHGLKYNGILDLMEIWLEDKDDAEEAMKTLSEEIDECNLDEVTKMRNL